MQSNNAGIEHRCSPCDVPAFPRTVIQIMVSDESGQFACASVIQMIFADVHKRMARPDTCERFLGVFDEKGVGITVNQTAAQLLQGVFYGKNFTAVIEIEWASPIS